MHSTIHPGHTHRHLSRRERQRLVRAQAFSRRTPKRLPAPTSRKLARDQLELIDRLVRRDRTPVSSALLQIAGIGAGEVARRAVLERVSEAAFWAQAERAISVARSKQIARHVRRALRTADVRAMALDVSGGYKPIDQHPDRAGSGRAGRAARLA